MLERVFLWPTYERNSIDLLCRTSQNRILTKKCDFLAVPVEMNDLSFYIICIIWVFNSDYSEWDDLNVQSVCVLIDTRTLKTHQMKCGYLVDHKGCNMQLFIAIWDVCGKSLLWQMIESIANRVCWMSVL